MVNIKKLTEWIAQHKSLSIVGKHIYCHPCNYFINARQKSHVEQIIMRLFILNKTNIFGAVASVGKRGPAPLIKSWPAGWPVPVYRKFPK